LLGKEWLPFGLPEESEGHPRCGTLYLSLCRVRGDVCLSHSLSSLPLPLFASVALCLSFCPYVCYSTSLSAASAEMYVSPIVSPFHLSLCLVRGHMLLLLPLCLSLYLFLFVSLSLPLPLCPRILCLSHGPMSLLLRICISLCRVRGRCMSLLSPRGAILGDLIWTIVCQKRPYKCVYVCVKGDLICVYVCVHILFFRYGTQIAAPGVFTPTAPSTSETRWWKGERKNAFEHFMVYCNPNSVLNIFKKKKQL